VAAKNPDLEEEDADRTEYLEEAEGNADEVDNQQPKESRYWRLPKTEKRVIRTSKYTGGCTLYCSGAPDKPQQYDDPDHTLLQDQPTHSPDCPFCPGNENRTPEPLLWVDQHGEMRTDKLEEGWLARAIPNIFPLVVTPVGYYPPAHYAKLQTIPHAAAAAGMNSDHGAPPEGNDEVAAFGISEVVVSSPLHNGLPAILNKTEVALSLSVVQARGQAIRQAHKQNSTVQDMAFFKQYGQMSGGSLLHPHYQILTLPYVSNRQRVRIRKAHTNYNINNECLTCVELRDVLDKSHEAHKRFLYENEHFVVLVPFCARQHAVHVVPKEHCHSWLDMPSDHMAAFGDAVQLTMQVVYEGLLNPDYVMYLVTVDTQAHLDFAQRELEDGDLKKEFHWWLEVLPRFVGDFGGIEAALGLRVCTRQGLPEDFAEELREVFVQKLKEREEEE